MSQFGYEPPGGGGGDGPRPDGLVEYDPTHPGEQLILAALLEHVEIPGHGRLRGTVHCFYSSFRASPDHFVLEVIEVIVKHPAALSAVGTWMAKFIYGEIAKKVKEFWAQRQQSDKKAGEREAPRVLIIDPNSRQPVAFEFKLAKKSPTFWEKARRWLNIKE